MTNDRSRSSSRSRRAAKSVAITTALAAAAGLVAAGIIYLKRRGIDPRQQAQKVKGRAKQAGTLLSGEAKAAYADVRAAIVLELQKNPDRKVSKKTIHDVIGATLNALRRRGSLTKEQLRAFGDQLRGDWKELQRQARTGRQQEQE